MGGGAVDDRTNESFHAFVVARWASLVRTAYLVTGDTGIAEDCAQDALVSVHRHWARLDHVGNPEAYARRVVINAALSWRRRRRTRELPLGAADGVPAPRDPALRLDPDLATALRQLPPRMRAVVVLRFVEDLSEAETAVALSCAVGTVKSTAHRGLAKLRRSLQPESNQAERTLR